jgi:hypothetical protein
VQRDAPIRDEELALERTHPVLGDDATPNRSKEGTFPAESAAGLVWLHDGGQIARWMVCELTPRSRLGA